MIDEVNEINNIFIYLFIESLKSIFFFKNSDLNSFIENDIE